MNRKIVLLLGAGLLAAMTSPAAPAYSDWFRVYNPARGIYAEVGITGADEAAFPGSPWVINQTALADPSQLGNYTRVMEGTRLSDVFGVASDGTDFYLTFMSALNPDDLGTWGPGIPDNLVVQETGVPLDATRYLDPGLRAAGYTAEFYSSVPDAGSSLALFALGLAGVVRQRRKT